MRTCISTCTHAVLMAFTCESSKKYIWDNLCKTVYTVYFFCFHSSTIKLCALVPGLRENNGYVLRALCRLPSPNWFSSEQITKSINLFTLILHKTRIKHIWNGGLFLYKYHVIEIILFICLCETIQSNDLSLCKVTINRHKNAWLEFVFSGWQVA